MWLPSSWSPSCPDYLNSCRHTPPFSPIPNPPPCTHTYNPREWHIFQNAEVGLLDRRKRNTITSVQLVRFLIFFCRYIFFIKGQNSFLSMMLFWQLLPKARKSNSLCKSTADRSVYTFELRSLQSCFCCYITVGDTHCAYYCQISKNENCVNGLCLVG